MLKDNRVLVSVGSHFEGFPYEVLNTAIYDPETEAWTVSGSLNTRRAVGTATLLPSGKVLVAAGSRYYNGPIKDVELYNPTSGIWVRTDKLAIPLVGQSATLLPDDTVLVAGGYSETSPSAISVSRAELYGRRHQK